MIQSHTWVYVQVLTTELGECDGFQSHVMYWLWEEGQGIKGAEKAQASLKRVLIIKVVGRRRRIFLLVVIKAIG